MGLVHRRTVPEAGSSRDQVAHHEQADAAGTPCHGAEVRSRVRVASGPLTHTAAMKRRTKIITAGAATVVIAGIASAGAVMASGAGDDEQPITGEALDRATTAALAEYPDGRVSETEIGDEDSLYEVEVTLPDGSQVDVQLDRDFVVVGSEPDDESQPDDD